MFLFLNYIVVLLILLPTITQETLSLRAFKAPELGHLSHCMDAWSKYSGSDLSMDGLKAEGEKVVRETACFNFLIRNPSLVSMGIL